MWPSELAPSVAESDRVRSPDAEFILQSAVDNLSHRLDSRFGYFV